jgi:hypothetical protein
MDLLLLPPTVLGVFAAAALFGLALVVNQWLLGIGL